MGAEISTISDTLSQSLSTLSGEAAGDEEELVNGPRAEALRALPCPWIPKVQLTLLITASFTAILHHRVLFPRPNFLCLSCHQSGFAYSAPITDKIQALASVRKAGQKRGLGNRATIVSRPTCYSPLSVVLLTCCFLCWARMRRKLKLFWFLPSVSPRSSILTPAKSNCRF